MEEIFTLRINKFKEQAEKLERKSVLFTTLRISTFILFLAFWIFSISEAFFLAFLISLLIFPFLFGYMVNRHRKTEYKKQFNQHLVVINQEEVQRLKHKPQHFYNGESFMDEEHPYTSDLDIFGPKSLYHLINRCATPSGEKTLANWLSTPADKKEVIARQQAVAELKEQIDWRQEIQATEMEIDKKMSINFFTDWLHAGPVKINPLIIFLLPALTIVAVGLWLSLDAVSFYIPLLVIFINGFFIYKYAQQTQKLSEVTAKGLAVLKKYRHIIVLIESKELGSEKLLEIQSLFHHNHYKASASLGKLERILAFLNSRSNLFYHLFNALFILDLQMIFRAEKWKAANKEYVSRWFDAIGDLEALSSMAGFSYGDDSLNFPTISEQEFIYDGSSLGHPLIHKSERVSNDYKMSGKGSVNIITGSNMSGKSTFLRTVCINAVLAYAGAPVCATKLELSIMDVFTSMRTHDDLEAHVSSFYAELKRIRKLLETLKVSSRSLLYALDEVLKGTNSRDRHMGALALARQLNHLNCMGMISTHDLELGELAKEKENILNFSFNSDIIDNKIVFDYKIHEGICRSFNASKLMEQMGIDINQQMDK